MTLGRGSRQELDRPKLLITKGQRGRQVDYTIYRSSGKWGGERGTSTSDQGRRDGEGMGDWNAWRHGSNLMNQYGSQVTSS